MSFLIHVLSRVDETPPRYAVARKWQDDGYEDLLQESRADASLQPLAACTIAEIDERRESGDPTEVALLRAAAALGADVSTPTRDARRQGIFRFNPARRLMSTVDTMDTELVVHTKGAPEAVLARCSRIADQDGEVTRLPADQRAALLARADSYAARGLRPPKDMLALKRTSIWKLRMAIVLPCPVRERKPSTHTLRML